MITHWSNCSPPCGGTGFQVSNIISKSYERLPKRRNAFDYVIGIAFLTLQIRAAHCTVKLNNVTQHVENNLCEDAGLGVPNTLQKCETNDCPHWIANDWQDCNSSRCFAWNTGKICAKLVRISYVVRDCNNCLSYFSDAETRNIVPIAERYFRVGRSLRGVGKTDDQTGMLQRYVQRNVEGWRMDGGKVRRNVEFVSGIRAVN